jgi:hypothetical protein
MNEQVLSRFADFSPASGIGVLAYKLGPFAPERHHHCIDIISYPHHHHHHPKFYFNAMDAAAGDVKEGNLITFNNPGDLTNSDGYGSIETAGFARNIIVRAVPQKVDWKQVGVVWEMPTHGMYVRADDTGNEFRIVDMWLKEDYSGAPYFKFEATTPGFIAVGYVLRGRKEGTWEIVFKLKRERKCGACGASCGSCASRG